MISKITAIFVITVYAFSINTALMYYISHNINIDYIVKYLCIQKDEVENMCGGSCQLKEKLQMAENNGEKDKSENIPPQLNLLSLHINSSSNFNENPINEQLLESVSNENGPVKIESLPETPPPQLFQFS